MCGAEHHHRHGWIAGLLLGNRNANRRMGIDQLTGLAQHGTHAGCGLLFIGVIG